MATTMIVNMIAVLMLLIGGASALVGPPDHSSIEDWCVWLFFVIVALIGLIILIGWPPPWMRA